MGEAYEGGPAFPQHDLSGYGIGPAMSGVDPSDEYSGKYEVTGMTLRQYYAGQALIGAMSCIGEEDRVLWDRIAEDCVVAADALLEALGKN